jgi:predicted nucleic acid-binding protein
MYLLDTDVISALRRPERNPAVAHWIATLAPDDLHLSAATIAEIASGVHLQMKKNPPYALTLSQWLDKLILQFDERILPLTVAIARRWGTLSATAGHDNLDFAIAATALEHNLIVVTRNVRHFAGTGVAIFDPFEGRLHGPE